MDLSTETAPTSRLTRALIVRCASPVLRAITPTRVARSARSRSRFSNAVSGSTDPTAAAGVVVKAASAGDAVGGAGSAKSCSASPGWVVCSTSSSRRALDDSARKASPVSPRSPRSATCSPTGPRSSAWLRSSSTSTASFFSRGSDGRKTWLICTFGAGVRRMKRPITWRKNSSVRAVVAYTPTRRRGTSTPSETISTDTSQGADPEEKRAIRADASAASECTMSGRSPVIRASRSASLSACSLSIATTRPPASGWSPARIVRSSSSASRRTWVIQSPSGSSAVRSRRAASGAGSTTSKSARRTRPSLTHSMSPP